MRICRVCEETKAKGDYYLDKSKGKDGRQTICKECHKSQVTARINKDRDKYNAYRRTCHLRTTFGMEREDFDNMLEEQGGVCKICKKKEEGKANLSVDHCHITGKIRGLLCGKCNTALGFVSDDSNILKSMIKYLEEK